jgi:hypothetical protein
MKPVALGREKIVDLPEQEVYIRGRKQLHG